MLDVTGIDVIAISYLEVTGSPVQLRYLVSRLRERALTARIIVGLWPQGEAALDDAAIQHMLEADSYVGSPTEPVTIIAGPVFPTVAAVGCTV